MIEVCDSLLAQRADASGVHRAQDAVEAPGGGFESSPRPLANPPAAALLWGMPTPGAAKEGFLGRFGGAQGFLNFMTTVAQSGGSHAAPLTLIGAPVPTMFAPGQWERILEQAKHEQAAGGAGPARPDPFPATGGAGRACVLRNPEFTLSSDARSRIDRYCAELRAAVAPFGTTRFDAAAWNDFWRLSFRGSEGIRMARQLLWLVKGLVKRRGGVVSTRVQYDGRWVDLLDAGLAPESFGDIVEDVPIHGQYIYDVHTLPSQFAIGSPFTSDETWDALRVVARKLRGKGFDCKPATGLDGDAFAAFRFLVEGIRHRNDRVMLDGTPLDVDRLDLVARGADIERDHSKANSGTPLERLDFYTTEDLRVARARPVPEALRFAPRPAEGSGPLSPLSPALTMRGDADLPGGEPLPHGAPGPAEGTTAGGVRVIANGRDVASSLPPVRMEGLEFQEEETRLAARRSMELVARARTQRAEEARAVRSAYEATPSRTIPLALRLDDEPPPARGRVEGARGAASKAGCGCDGAQGGPSL
ncbi:MAG: hypothetical protein ACT4PV_09680 [Planctomycetaceae bacterium]